MATVFVLWEAAGLYSASCSIYAKTIATRAWPSSSWRGLLGGLMLSRPSKPSAPQYPTAASRLDLPRSVIDSIPPAIAGLSTAGERG